MKTVKEKKRRIANFLKNKLEDTALFKMIQSYCGRKLFDHVINVVFNTEQD